MQGLTCLLGRRAISCHCMNILRFMTALLASATTPYMTLLQDNLLRVSQHNQWASEMPIPLPDCILARKYQKVDSLIKVKLVSGHAETHASSQTSRAIASKVWSSSTYIAKQRATVHALQQYSTCPCWCVNNPDLPQPRIVYIGASIIRSCLNLDQSLNTW